MKKHSAFQALIKNPSFTGREAKKHGIDPHLLSYYVRKGIIERVSRGVYRNPNVENSAPFEWQDLLEIAQSISGGVICLISALSYYGLTQEIQRQFWIAVPHASKAPRRPMTKIVRMRNTTLGKKRLAVGNYRTFIFDRERCIIDAFRYLSRETAVRSLREYLKPTEQHKPDLSKLARYAKALRVKIIPYIEALT
ncbi:MAG: type IV toxin-antitoxin system AbiEi family antitoxin domain-containing protein [Gammaproteobacteria bacterium]